MMTRIVRFIQRGLEDYRARGLTRQDQFRKLVGKKVLRTPAVPPYSLKALAGLASRFTNIDGEA